MDRTEAGRFRSLLAAERRSADLYAEARPSRSRGVFRCGLRQLAIGGGAAVFDIRDRTCGRRTRGHGPCRTLTCGRAKPALLVTCTGKMEAPAALDRAILPGRTPP